MDIGKPFERLTMVDDVKKYADVDFNEISTVEEAQAIAKEKGIEFEQHHKKGDILNLFFEAVSYTHLCTGNKRVQVLGTWWRWYCRC